MTFQILDGVGGLRSSGPVTLNWLFLVESIVLIILVLFYFFYFNRLLAIIISWLLRLKYFKKTNSYIDIGAIQFSLLGGRIDFSDARYISRNMSISVVQGSIKWQYWHFKVRSEEDKLSEQKRPCRMNLSVNGAEWFLYNRTPSYDAILEELGVKEKALDELGLGSAGTSGNGGEKVVNVNLDGVRSEGSSGRGAGEYEEKVPVLHKVVDATVAEKETRKKGTDWLREALPIQIKVQKGSIIMGNPSTANILIAGFDNVSGTYAAVKSRSQFDHYKEVYRMNFTNPKIVFRTNPDYVTSMNKNGEEVLERMKLNPDFLLSSFLHRPALFASLNPFRYILSHLPLPQSQSRSAPTPVTPDPPISSKAPSSTWAWQGLARYQALDSTSSTVPTHRVEYAKVTTLLSSPELELTYYCDYAGKVPAVPRMVTGFQGLETEDIGNGDLSPEWGVDLVVKGGVITYGPWADRQRYELQQAFTPTTFYNVTQTPRLKAGQDRMHTALKVFVEFSEGATLRVPTRETSKDWKYDGLETSTLNGPSAMVRPFGWLDISLGPDSTLSYVLPMVATAQGFDTLVEFHLDQFSVASSVNYAPFLMAETCRVHCGLPSPLIWDALRIWVINITITKPDISLLRDHITLFTDIAKDWTSGPPGDYEHFVPFNYVLNLNILDYVLKLFVNDHNIINNPTMAEDNSLLIAKGPRIQAKTLVPSDKYRMDVSTVTFSVEMPDLALSMTMPDWNTQNAFLTEHTKTFATTPDLSIEGTYRFYAAAHPEHVERLAIDVRCSDVIFKSMGWMARHLFNLRDNYFGTFTHFVTLEEYRHRHERNLQGDPLELKFRPGAMDVFEVAVTLDLRSGLMVLPQELYDCRSAVVLVLPQLRVDLRNHDFFMEMSLNLDPFRVVEAPDCPAFLRQSFNSIMEVSDSIRVQGLEITANRLFGPQPRTDTYMCIWSIYLGGIIGNIPPSFLQAFSRAGESVGRSFVDQDNSLPPDFSVALAPDATFLTVDIYSIDLAIRGQGTAIQVALPKGIAIRFDDLATKPFLKHIDIDLPVISLRFLAPLFGRAAPWMEVASLDADFSIVLGLSESGWELKAANQARFIKEQDAVTQRCPFIYGSQAKVSSPRIGSLYLPGLAAPLTRAPQHRGSRIAHDSRSDSDDESDTEDLEEEDDESDSSEDDYHAIYSQLPERRTGNADRFSAYGAILKLCHRAPEASYLDKPTFRRLAENPPSTSHAKVLPCLNERLAAFEATSDRKTIAHTVIDVRSRQPIRIVLTPVAAQVGGDVLDGVTLDPDLERILDMVLCDYTTSKERAPPERYANVQVKASIPSVQIESIQDVLRPEDTISIKHKDVADSEPTTTVLCTVRLTLDHVSLSLDQTDDKYGAEERPDLAPPSISVEQKLAARAGGTRLEVLHSPRSISRHDTANLRKHRSLPSTSSRTQPSALDLHIGPCDLQFDLNTKRGLIGLHGGEARLDFVDEAAELVIGSLWSWRVLRDVLKPLREREVEKALLQRHLVWSIVQAAESSRITTFPAFLNRVSYLVGSSSNLRSDDGWKTLHHLRHCLRLASTDVNQRMAAEKAAWPSPEDLFAEVVATLSQWQSWEIDSDNLGNSPLLRSVYGASMPSVEGGPSGATISWKTPVTAEWTAGRFSAHLWDGDTTSNRLGVGPVSALIASSGQGNGPLGLQGRVSLDTVEAEVDQDLVQLVRHIIKVRRTFERKIMVFRESMNELPTVDARRSDDSTSDALASIPSMHIDASFGLRRVVIKGRAGQLIASTHVNDTNAAVSIFVEPTLSRSSRPLAHQINASTCVLVGGVVLAATELEGVKEELLLSVELTASSFTADAVGSHTWDGGRMDEVPCLRVFVGTEGVRWRVPREAIRVYQFADTWKSENLPTYDSLLSELREGLEEAHERPVPRAESTSPSFVELLLAKARLGFQISLPLLAFEIQATPTLKMEYQVAKLSGFAHSNDHSSSQLVFGPLDGGVHIAAQRIKFSSGTSAADEASSLPAFELPALRVKAHLDDLPCRKVKLLATLDSISIKLTPAIINNIFIVQKRVGKDVDELVAMVKKVKSKRPLPSTTGSPATSPIVKESSNAVANIGWEVLAALRGFKIGFAGLHATQWLEASLLEGRASSSPSRLHWAASVQNLVLSLAQRTGDDDDSISVATFDRRNRLAFFQLDLSLSNAVINLPELPAESMYGDDQTPHLHIRLPRAHAVMQPSAVEALENLIDHYEEELGRHAVPGEMEAMRDRVVSSFETEKLAADKAVDGRSWFSSCVISLETQNIGIAIPLSADGIAAPSLSPRRPKGTQSRPAFLATINSVKFATQKGSAGYARVEELAFQFVSDFDQGRKEHYKPASHDSFNRAVLPSLHCTVRSLRQGPIAVDSVVSGIVVDLEPSLVAYTLSLVDVYQESHQRFARFAPQDSTIPALAPLPSKAEASLPVTSPCNGSTLLATFEVKSGTIRMHSPRSAWNRKQHDSSKPPRAVRPGHNRMQSMGQLSSQFRAKPEQDAHVDTFRLPGTSVWAKWQEGATDADISVLHVDVRIHASKNTLMPTLIPFISDVASQLKSRALKSPTSSSPSPTPASPSLPGQDDAPLVKMAAGSRVKFGLSLKIDESTLEISCAPAAKVTARLTWASGGFLLSMSPGVKGVDFALTVDGLEAGVKHWFAAQDCLHAQAKGLSVNVSFTAAVSDGPTLTPGILSAIIELPEISADMNFRQLHDWLCLKSVWIDRMDLGPISDEPSAPIVPLVAVPDDTSSRISTIMLLSIGKIQLKCDLGATIGKASFVADRINTRLRSVPGESRSLSFAVARLQLAAQGRSTGAASVDGIYFETHLRDDSTSDSLSASDLLHMKIGLGKQEASFEHEFHKLLLFVADPIAITATDDWSRITDAWAELELAFQLRLGSFNVIATVGTIPTLVRISKRIDALLEEQAALADGMIAAAGLPPRPSTSANSKVALSAVASKLSSSVNDPLTGKNDSPVHILNRLDIALERIRIAIFPENFNDGEVYRVDTGQSIRANLVRRYDALGTAHRSLELFVGFFSIRKVNHRQVSAEQDANFSVPEWYELFKNSQDRNIFKSPSAKVSMVSEQAAGSHRVEHRFNLSFGGKVDLALHWGLVRTLKELVNTYEEQMKLAVADWLPPTTPALDFQQDATVITPPEMASPEGVATQSIGTDALGDLNSQVVKMKLLPLVQAATGERTELEYVPLESHIEHLELKLLGEATPPVEWFGLQTQRVPAWIHTGVTIPLEEVVSVLSSTYQTQLARQKLEGRYAPKSRA